MTKPIHISCVKRRDGEQVFFLPLASAQELAESEEVFTGFFIVEHKIDNNFCSAKPEGEMRRSKLSLARAGKAALVRPDFIARAKNAIRRSEPARVLKFTKAS